ncbi:hypothetical protein MASR1M97_04650 [Candidatus Desulfobacillus denitrificans]
MTIAALPTDIDALRAMVLAQQAQIEHLKLVIAKLRRMQFGRRSEQLGQTIDQLELALEELETAKAQSAAPAVAAEPAEANKPARKPLPAYLPREEVVLAPAHACCPDCGGALKRLGEDVAELLEYVPARFKVVRQIRPKLACARCDAIVQAEAPDRPIRRGLAGPGLLAHVLAAKYCDHLPLYRQSEIYAREGVELERSTLAEWVGQSAALLSPLVEALRRHVLSGDKVHADDTPVPVLAPGSGKTKTGRLWTYVRDDRPAAATVPPAVWFAYSPNRRGEHPQRHLASFAGILQADAYAGFEALYAGGRVQEAACWAHVRRKFYDIHQAHGSPLAAEALSRIGALYGIEADIRGKPPDHRRAARRGAGRPAARRLAPLAGGQSAPALAEIGPGRGDPLCHHALDGAHPLCGRRAHRDRQQRRGAGAARGGPRAQELSVRRVGRRRRARRRPLQSDRHGETQRPGSGGLPAPGSCLHRRASDQPYR